MPKIKNIKCVAVGDGAVGKTSLLHAYVDETFTTEYVPTIFDNEQVNIKVDGKDYVLGIWDTAGQEGFDRLRPLSYPESDIFLICFDVTNDKSFSNLKAKWIAELQHHQPGTPFMVVGTKVDLRGDPSVENSDARTQQEYEQEAMSLGALTYIECSAKSRVNLNEVFETAVRNAMEYKKQQAKAMKEKTGALPGDESGGCCIVM
mmetsp:Transcript_14627/g.16589  ORF Transcript_14627/g.16589 Transcript_14627/m.16589 type:complete len:204 (+) Transcript_14627:119-730(+)